MGVELEKSEVPNLPSSPIPEGHLTIAAPPNPKAPAKDGDSNARFSRKIPDHSKRDAENRKLGLAGELLVLQYEKEELLKSGRSDLAMLVRHIAVTDGDNAGYDIRSFYPDGRLKFIEVKTTAGGPATEFFASSNEISFSQKHPTQYVLYRVYDFSQIWNSARCFVINGPIHESFALSPTQYRLRLKSLLPH